MRLLRASIAALLVSLVISAVLSYAAWILLPYDLLDRESSVERFALWEGVMWGAGLAGAFFGAAAFFGSTDLYAPRSVEDVHERVANGVRGQLEFSELPAVPWILLGCGIILMLIAAFARSVAVG